MATTLTPTLTPATGTATLALDTACILTRIIRIWASIPPPLGVRLARGVD
jgi:hypothetical protein